MEGSKHIRIESLKMEPYKYEINLELLGVYPAEDNKDLVHVRFHFGDLHGSRRFSREQVRAMAAWFAALDRQMNGSWSEDRYQRSVMMDEGQEGPKDSI